MHTPLACGERIREGDERGMRTRRQEHGGFDGVHLYFMCEWEQQSRYSGPLFKLIWMVDAHVAFVV